MAYVKEASSRLTGARTGTRLGPRALLDRRQVAFVWGRRRLRVALAAGTFTKLSYAQPPQRIDQTRSVDRLMNASFGHRVN